MNDKPEIKPKGIEPLKHICMTIGELPSSYLETMSYYEMLLWFTKFLQERMIPALDNNALAVEELQHLYIELRDYVNNYFDNLNVQEEINNKLDQMLEDGVLEQIIEQYLNSSAVWGFDSVADMKEATNLINGSYAKTLGYYSKNDGGSSTYKIRTITNDDVVNEMNIIELQDDTLIAELVCKDTINIKQIGSHGDGTNDDTDIIQFALNNYNVILIPEGTHLVTGLTLPEKTTIRGLKNNGSILQYNGNNNGNVITIGNSSNYIFDTWIDNLKITQSSGITGVNGIEYVFKNPAYSKISNCYITNLSGDGIKGGFSGHVNNVEIFGNFITSCENNINLQYKTGQINAIWIHHNNIVSARKNGILFAGNNVIIESNTIQANKKHGISVGDSDWDGTYYQATLGSVIKDNYTELNGNNYEYSVIGIYSGHVAGRAYNRYIRKLEINNNYFGEINNGDNNIIYCSVDTASPPSYKACEIIAENNYSNVTKFIDFNFLNALSYGSIIKNNHGGDGQTYPYYVIHDNLNEHSPENGFKDNYQNMIYNEGRTIGANATKQNTYLVYFESDTISSSELNQALRQLSLEVIINGFRDYGNAGRYNCKLEKIGSNVNGNDGSITKQIESGGEYYVPNISPITLVEGMSEITGNATLGLQFTISSHNNLGFPYFILLNAKANKSYINYLKVKSLTPNIKKGTTAPSGDINYKGEVYVDDSNGKWYVASDLSTWREASTN